jgi:hypothetical protein
MRQTIGEALVVIWNFWGFLSQPVPDKFFPNYWPETVGKFYILS